MCVLSVCVCVFALKYVCLARLFPHFLFSLCLFSPSTTPFRKVLALLPPAHTHTHSHTHTHTHTHTPNANHTSLLDEERKTEAVTLKKDDSEKRAHTNTPIKHTNTKVHKRYRREVRACVCMHVSLCVWVGAWVGSPTPASVVSAVVASIIPTQLLCVHLFLLCCLWGKWL